MPKTYGTVTTFTAGSVLTAAQLNVASTAVNNLVVPASCQVQRGTDLTGYTSNTDIAWDAAASWDTDSMFSGAGATSITINTTGLYLVQFWCYWTATATVTQNEPQILVGGAVVRGGNTFLNASTANVTERSGVLSLSATNTVSARMLFAGGSAYVIKGSGGTGHLTSRLTLTWIGRTS